MNFKQNLKNLRESRGLTQYDMAKLLDMDINTYRYMEQEKKESKTIAFKTLEDLTKILNCDYNDLLLKDLTNEQKNDHK